MARTLILLCILASSNTWAATLHYVGTAYSLVDKKPVYSEHYAEQFDTQARPLACSVTYRDTNDQLVATKSLDYARHPYAPAFRFSNQRTGYQESVEWLDDGRLRLTHQDKGARRQEKILQVGEPVVADAGFNNYIRDHLPALLQGETLAFNFLNPARLDWFRFTATLISQTPQAVTVKVAPANTLLSWLVSPIELVYSKTDQRLLEYRGLTNISLDGSSNVSGNIYYQYQDSTLSALLPSPDRIE